MQLDLSFLPTQTMSKCLFFTYFQFSAPLTSSPVWARDFSSSEELITEFCRECRIVRKGIRYTTLLLRQNFQMLLYYQNRFWVCESMPFPELLSSVQQILFIISGRYLINYMCVIWASRFGWRSEESNERWKTNNNRGELTFSFCGWHLLSNLIVVCK